MSQESKMSAGLLYGLILGAVSILFTLGLYLAGAEAFVGPVAYLGYVIPIVLSVLAGIAHKKMNGGFLEFGAALKTCFTVFVVGSLISTLFSYVLFNFIDVPFQQALNQEYARSTEAFMKKLGAPEADTQKTVDTILTGENYTLNKLLVNFAVVSILWFLISLIIAAIVKKAKPVFQ